MCDRMNFPKTPEEFIKTYSFVDKEEIYTNGSELIDVYRVEQMLEFYFKSNYIVRCKNCIHFHDNDCPITWQKDEEDFCSFAERIGSIDGFR